MQTTTNVGMYYKLEDTFGVPPDTVTGAKVFRQNASPGFAQTRPLIAPGEIRDDGMTSQARLGSKSVTASLPADFSVSTFDDMIEAVLRSTWVAAVTINVSDITSATFGANTIAFTSGSPITLGVRIGDMIRVLTSVTTANNNKNLRVTALSATTITVAETLTIDATPDTTVTLKIMKKLKQSSVLTRRSFTFEEYYKDIDQSAVAHGVRVSSIKITGNPDSTALIEVGLVGVEFEPLAADASPYFDSPTKTETIALVFADATFRINGADVASPTAFELTIDLGAKGQPGLYIKSPDIFEGNAKITGSVSLIRSDLANMTTLDDETKFEFHLLMVEPEGEPKDHVSLFLGNVMLTGLTKAIGGDGAMVETLPLNVGSKGTATGYDNSMITVCTSAA